MTTVVSAAIVQDGVVYSVPAPGRHHHVIKKIIDLNPELDRVNGKQGFLTDEGTFVDRLEAAKIAIASGQIKELKWPPYLYSEDLW